MHIRPLKYATRWSRRIALFYCWPDRPADQFAGAILTSAGEHASGTRCADGCARHSVEAACHEFEHVAALPRRSYPGIEYSKELRFISADFVAVVDRGRDLQSR